jgi:pyruvate formate lyase activating enzyme
MYDHKICKRFGDCIKADPGAVRLNQHGVQINRSAIVHPEKFRGICLSRALTVAGEHKSVDELLLEIEKDVPFYHRSKGGVTLSGGEPLSQGADLVILLKELKKRNIDVSVETTLYVNWMKVERCLGLIGTYLVDLKHTNREKFRLYTQGNIQLVLDNLKKLADSNENIIIRIPVIPEFNHSEHEMKRIIDYAASLNHIREIHFIPYHALGIEKYAMLGMDYVFGPRKPVDHNELTGYLQYAQSKGFNTRIGG